MLTPFRQSPSKANRVLGHPDSSLAVAGIIADGVNGARRFVDRNMGQVYLATGKQALTSGVA
jgi:hypothetical protein